MGRFESAHNVWPPAGWGQFASVQSSSAQAVAKDIGTARIYGLQYRIESTPLFKNDERIFRHDFIIEGWEYSILNESTEYPVLSLSLLDRFDPDLPHEYFIAGIQSLAEDIPHTRRSASRAVSAALFFIKQIAAGNVPDIGRALQVYKLHPAQAFLYRGRHMSVADLKNVFKNVKSAGALRG